MYISEQNKRGWRLLGVPFIFAIFLLAVPIATMTALSFWTRTILTLIKNNNFENYKQAWFQPVFQTLFARSLIISLTVTFLQSYLHFLLLIIFLFMEGRERPYGYFL